MGAGTSKVLHILGAAVAECLACAPAVLALDDLDLIAGSQVGIFYCMWMQMENGHTVLKPERLLTMRVESYPPLQAFFSLRSGLAYAG